MTYERSNDKGQVRKIIVRWGVIEWTAFGTFCLLILGAYISREISFENRMTRLEESVQTLKEFRTLYYERRSQEGRN